MTPPAHLISGPDTSTPGVRCGRDFVDDLRDQLDEVRAGRRRLVRLLPGRHQIHASSLARRACYISNHDAGERAVLFNLSDIHGITIDGQGAELVFHGEVIPFLFEHCRDLTVRDLSIDWARPFLSQGLVLEADEQQLHLEMDADHPFEVRDGRPIFTGAGYRSDCLHNMLAFDPDRRETAFRTPDHYEVMRSLQAEKVDASNPRRLRLRGDFRQPTPPGQVMVIKHHTRASPALCFVSCSGVEVDRVRVHHAGGMGFVAQASRDLRLQRCVVAPPPGSSRLFSTHADATHFTDCHGKIELLDCTFENQLDDATNIHGVYRRIDGSGRTREVSARLIHHQQDGLRTVSAGDQLAFTDQRSFAVVDMARVVEVKHFDSRSCVYSLDREVDLGEGHAVAMRWDPEIEVRIAGCVAGKNRARGFLISTLGRVVIEDNVLHTPGSAIQCCCDASSWYESGPVQDLTVRRNRFEDCLYGVWGRGLIAVNPVLDPSADGPAVNKRIRVIDNEIVTSDPRLVFAKSIESFEFTGNRLESSSTYLHDIREPVFDIDSSVSSVSIQSADSFAADFA